MTTENETINHQKLLIPSFSTTSAIFNKHLTILKDLKKRIDGLKHAYLKQREEERVWEIVDRILDILDKGCNFLDFNKQEHTPTKEPLSPISDESPFK